MDKRQFVLSWVRRFAIIHGFTMIALFLLGLLFRPDATFGIAFLGKMILFSFAGTLPGFVYMSRHELTEREWWIRTLIQYILLNVLLLPISRYIGLWSGVSGVLMMMTAILAIDIAVHIASFGMDCAAAADINRLIRKKQKD